MVAKVHNFGHDGAVANHRALTDRVEKKVAKDYAAGHSTAYMAMMLGVSVDVIRAAVLRQGGTLRPRGSVPGTPRARLRL